MRFFFLFLSLCVCVCVWWRIRIQKFVKVFPIVSSEIETTTEKIRKSASNDAKNFSFVWVRVFVCMHWRLSLFLSLFLVISQTCRRFLSTSLFRHITLCTLYSYLVRWEYVFCCSLQQHCIVDISSIYSHDFIHFFTMVSIYAFQLCRQRLNRSNMSRMSR